VGGALPSGSASYIVRSADAEVLDALRHSEFCYILDSRQKGKSSLVTRAAQILNSEGTRVAQIDLQRLGANVTAEQWFGGLAHQLAKSLGLVWELTDYWKTAARFGPELRWIGFLEEIALPSSKAPLVIIIDEVDFVRSLPFDTDEFFAGIRGLANARAVSKELRSLSVILVGTSTPSQLIREPLITPFNIGRPIALKDFTRDELKPYEAWLPGGAAVVDRVYEWTSGHPYFTQFVCSLLPSSPEQVDSIVKTQLISEVARRTEPNLCDTERRILETKLVGMDEVSSRAAILSFYGEVLRGDQTVADETNALYTSLRLAGVAVHSGGRLVIRNRIYRENFDENWRSRNLPDAEARRIKRVSRAAAIRAFSISGVIIVIISLLASYGLQQARAKGDALARLSARTREFDRNAYNSGLALASQRMEDQEWRGVRKIVEQLSGSESRGWEWDYLNAVTEPGQLIRKLANKSTDIMFLRNGEPFVPEDISNGSRKFFANPDPDFHFKDLSEVRAYWAHFDTVIGRRDFLISGFLPDGSYLANDERRFWKVRPGQAPKLTFTIPGNDVLRFVAISHDGSKCFVSTVGGSLAGYDLVTGKSLWNESIGVFSRLAVSHDGAILVAIERPGTIAILNAKTGEALRRMDGHRGIIATCEFSPSGEMLLTAGEDGTVRIWNWKLGTEIERVAGSSSVYQAARYSSNSSIITLDDDGSMRRLTLPIAQHERVYKLSDRGVLSLEVSSDSSRLAAASNDGYFAILDRKTWKAIASVRISPTSIRHGIAISKDNRRVFVSDRGLVRTFDAKNGKELKGFAGPAQEIYQLKVSPDGHTLAATGAYNDAWIWDLDTGSFKFRLQGHTAIIRGLDFSPDGRLIATASIDGHLRLWSNIDGRLVFDKDPSVGQLLDCSFTPDSQTILVASAIGIPLVVPVDANLPLRKLDPHYQRTYAILQSPDLKQILCYGNDGVTRVMDIASGHELCQLRCDDFVSQAAWFDQGRRIVTVSGDRAVRVWDSATGDELLRLMGHQSDVMALAIADSGNTIVTSSTDGTVREWSRLPLSQ
jgi:WD40 repeat protein